MSDRWHIAYTDARAEQDACTDINAIGFQAYCPIERHKRFTRGRKIYIEQALFPRYLFCRFDTDEPHWNEIREVDGIGGILCNQNIPSPVPNGLTEKLMRMQRLGLFDHTKAPNPFPPGTAVVLDDDGPFAELIGKVMRVRTGDRVDLLINYLNREMTVNVSLARLSHV